MPITLATPETYPSSPQARIVAIGANVENKTLMVVVNYGSVIGGIFVPKREVRYDFTVDTTPTFTQVVSAVPQFAQLRNALEQYLVDIGRITGSVS